MWTISYFKVINCILVITIFSEYDSRSTTLKFHKFHKSFASYRQSDDIFIIYIKFGVSAQRQILHLLAGSGAQITGISEKYICRTIKNPQP